MKNIKLKPCPFCGKSDTEIDHGIRGYLIKCNYCKCNTGTYPSWDNAIEGWNIRKQENVMEKIDISKVDCCDACFEEYRFTPSKMRKPFCKISINNKTIKFCEHHAKMLKDELLSYEKLND